VKHIVSFSGGKDSTAMLLMMAEKGMPIDEIVFCDTGMEFPAMYKHIAKVEAYIKRPITVIKPRKSFEYYLWQHQKVKGKHKGKRGYGWTGHKFRWCTKALKVGPIKIHLAGKKHFMYLGIAYDEYTRLQRKQNQQEHYRFPLVDFKVAEAEALRYCYKKGFDWSGLYEKFRRVSCWCCPLQRIGELKTLYCDFPELWKELKRLDKLSYRQFKSHVSVEELDKRFRGEAKLEAENGLFEVKRGK